MAYLDINHVAIKGISACVPQKKELICSLYDRYNPGGYNSFYQTTGIAAHRIADADTCSSDLCVEAAEKLVTELGWEKKDIDALLFVSQTPDYILPATSCIIQEKLGLGSQCYTLDISLGCSGWVYGLSVLNALMQGGTIRKGLLLAGDTILKFCSKDDKSTYPLFGDAGTATALEYTKDSVVSKFVMNTDGSGKETIIIYDGGYRNPVTEASLVRTEQGEGIVRNRLDLILDGMSVFSFGISQAPKSVNDLVEHFALDKEDIDCFTFHQANMFMNEKIRKKLKLPVEKVPYSLEQFGNTSCASIPLTLVFQKRKELKEMKMKHMCCGFGVGLSWASVYFETDHIAVPELIEI